MSSRHTPRDLPAFTLDARQQMLLGFVSKRESDCGRLARFLHDEVGQVLSAVGLHLDALRHDFGAGMPEFDQRAVDIQQMLETVIGSIRDFSSELHPSVVLRIGLQTALDRLTARFRSRFSGVLLAQLDPAVRIPHDRAEGMYRGAEAALEVAVAASRCTQIEVQLKRQEADFVLEIRPNAAVDFDAESSFPALLMSYYANRGAVTLSIIPSGENGTIVRFSCPAAI